MTIEVKATRQGFYGGALREINEEFEIENETHLGSWMVRKDGKANPAIAKMKKALSIGAPPIIDAKNIKANLDVSPTTSLDAGPAKKAAPVKKAAPAKKPSLDVAAGSLI